MSSHRKVSPLCIAGIAEERHLLVHNTTDRTSPGKIGTTANEGNSDEREDSEKQSQEKPGFDFALLPVSNDRG